MDALVFIIHSSFPGFQNGLHTSLLLEISPFLKVSSSTLCLFFSFNFILFISIRSSSFKRKTMIKFDIPINIFERHANANPVWGVFTGLKRGSERINNRAILAKANGVNAINLIPYSFDFARRLFQTINNQTCTVRAYSYALDICAILLSTSRDPVRHAFYTAKAEAVIDFRWKFCNHTEISSDFSSKIGWNLWKQRLVLQFVAFINETGRFYCLH